MATILSEVLVNLEQWNLSNHLARVEALSALDLDADGFLSIREALVMLLFGQSDLVRRVVLEWKI